MKKISLILSILTILAADDYSLNFDGDNDYAAIENMHYDQSGQISELTVSAWVKVPLDGGSWSIVDFDRSEYFNCVAGENYGSVASEGDRVGFHTRANNGGIRDMWSSGSIRDNQWHHIVWVFDSQEQYDKKIYIDGVLDAQQDAYSTNSNLGSGAVRYGFLGDGSEANSYNAGKNNIFYHGRMDQVSIWHRAFASDEINSLLNINNNENDLVAYWPMEEGSGNTVIDFGPLGYDVNTFGATWVMDVPENFTATNTAPTASPLSVELDEDNELNITLEGDDSDGDALTYTLQTEPVNGSLEQINSSVLDFDGSNDYVKLPDFSYLDDLSFAAWVKIDSRNYWERIFDFGKGGQGDMFLTTMGGRTGGNLEMTIHPFGATHTINAGTTCDDGQWHHVVFTYDKGGSGMTLYIDGISVGSNSYNSASFSDFGAGQNFYLGKANWNDPYYDGKMEQVGLYDKALSPTEVSSIYNSGSNSNLNSNFNNYISSNNLIGYWKMNDGSGSTAVDYSGNGNDASIHGASWDIQGNPNEYIYAPSPNYNGQDSFTFTVSDGEQTSSEATVHINVASVNDMPVLTSTPSVEAVEGSEYNYTVEVSDVDGNTPTMTISGAEWLTMNNNILSGTPDHNDGGLHNILITVDDNDGGILEQSYTLAVAVHSLEITQSGYRMMSSPVSGAVYSNLLDELWTQGSINSDLYWGDPNLFTYGGDWTPVLDLNTQQLAAGEGFLMYVFADTDWDGEDDLPAVISIDGDLNDTPVSVTTSSSDWNLIGNPYGLPVDINQMLTDNITFNSTVYVLDQENPGYKTHNGTVGDIVDGSIKPFEGFWVQAGPEGSNFNFTEECVLSGSFGAQRTSTDNESNGSAVFTFSTGEFSSSVFLSFTPEGEINLDPSDAHRFVPMEPSTHLTSMVYESTKSLAINNLPLEMNTDITLDMDVMMLEPSDTGYETQQSQVNMSWDMSNLPEGINVALQNNVTGYMVNLDGSAMNLTLLSKGGFELNGDLMETYPEVGESQFTLIITTDFASSDDELTTANNFKLHSAYPNPFNPSTKIRFDLTEVDMVSMDIFDISGRQVATLINEIMIPGSHEVNWNPGELSSGVYLIKLNAGENSMNQKVTYIK